MNKCSICGENHPKTEWCPAIKSIRNVTPLIVEATDSHPFPIEQPALVPATQPKRGRPAKSK